MSGEEGAARLVVEMFDELRVEYFALRHTPGIGDDVRAWLAHDLPPTVHIRNPRAAALAYGYLVGHHVTGAWTIHEIAGTRHHFETILGPAWTDTFDQLLAEGFAVRPGGSLIELAHTWDELALNPPT